VISIRRYLQQDQKGGDPLLPLLQILLEGMGTHTVEGAPGESALRESTQRVLSALELRAPPAELLALGANAVDALRQHNSGAAEHHRQPIAELQAKVRLLTDAVTSISSSSPENVRRLEQMKGQLLSTMKVKEIHSLRERLSQYLDEVLTEAERRRSELDRIAEELNRPSRRTNPTLGTEEAAAIDATTGLPARSLAEEAIAECCQEEANAFVAIMVINQVQTINRGAGVQSGDVMLQRFAAFIRQQLPGIDQVFRWSGPTVVALLRRRSALDVRCVIQPLLLQRLTVRIGTPDVQVPISARWTVLPLMASPRLLFHKMDSFAGIGEQSEDADLAQSA
jgi:GGDEF domain-containing protein